MNERTLKKKVVVYPNHVTQGNELGFFFFFFLGPYYFTIANKQRGSIYMTARDKGWNLLIGTLFRTFFPFMWIREVETKALFPLSFHRMSHHHSKINQNLFYVHTLDFAVNAAGTEAQTVYY